MICEIDGCDSPKRAKNWCNKHYQRWYKFGDPLYIKEKIPYTSPAWEHRGPYNGCWEWTGGVVNKNDEWAQYGRVNIKGKLFLTHRLVYEISYGEIPEGLEVCHKCDNTLCWRPDHLFLGTRTENTHDAVKKGRMAHKLSEDEVRAIREAVASGEAQHSVASRFGITQSYVSEIVLGKKRHLVSTGGK
jgi:hypothetical protein